MKIFDDVLPFAILGPCVIESHEHASGMAELVKEIAYQNQFLPVFKASYEKANRTSATSFAGHGIDEGLRILADIREKYCVPVTTDVHESGQVAQVAAVVDILQIPAFLCRQTPLLQACAESGKIVNVKKAQFMSGDDMLRVVDKLQHFGAHEVIVTERGAMFGYNNLIVDFRNLVIMKRSGAYTCFDATHSVQRPGGQGETSGGDREFAPVLACAAAAVGVDGYFLETHENPDFAPSDGPNMIPTHRLTSVLGDIRRFHGLRQDICTEMN